VRFTDHNDGRITVEWTLDYEEMIEAGYIIQAAGIGSKGETRDRGWYDDGTALFEAGMEAQEQEKFGNEPGLRIGVVHGTDK